MTPTQRDQVIRHISGATPLTEFIAEFGVDPRTDRDFVPSQLRLAMANKAADDLACTMYLAFRFDLNDTWAPFFSELLEQDWHRSHEALATALQDIRDPSTVASLLRTATKRLAYLEFDEAFALAVKCIWALHDIATDDAIAALKQLALSEVPTIRDSAQERLLHLARRKPGDPVQAYRLARDARVRRARP